MESFFILSPIGVLHIVITKGYLYSISKISNKLEKANLKQQKLSTQAKSIKKQLNLYFKGRLKSFDIPLYQRGTEFQQKAWKALQQIPWGQTQTYSEIAKNINHAKACRAVGTCCSKNPFLIVVPCHRVVSTNGLGGFAIGLKNKKFLLNLEKENLNKVFYIKKPNKL